MADIDLISDKAMNRVVSKLEPVQRAVWDETQAIGTRARANLTAHRQTGNAKIETEFGKTDGLVSLVDPSGNAKAIEFGHFLHSAKFPRYVVGLYIITKAAGLA